ncbi:VanZ family protein [Winogradskyella sp. A3E31]|uniref:VanZ family protein n=1 Tax=Winogradskyella sp. A3E31 TaxID=3349637 RepID=UPI00398AC563
MDKLKVFWLIVSVVYTFVLIYFSLANVDSIMPDSETYPIDKVLHFIAYTVLSILWAICYHKAFSKKHNRALLISLLFFGICMESTQEIISPFRTFDWLDLIANCAGVVSGMIIATYLLKSKVKMD